MFKLIIFLSISMNLLFASIESEVEKERFIEENGVLVDNFTGLIWEDFKTRKLETWWDSKRYCNGLQLVGRNNWRIPFFTDVVSLKNNTKYKLDYGDYNYYWFIDQSNRAYTYNFYDKTRKKSSYVHYLKCVSGPRYTSYDELKKVIEKNRKEAINKKLNDYFINIVQKSDSIEEYERFLKKYPKTSLNEKIEKRLKELYSNEIKKLKKENRIIAYENFLKIILIHL